MTNKSPGQPPVWRRYLRFWGSNVEADVDDELRFHLDMRARDYEARGLDFDDARRAAVERFGDVQGIGGALRTHDRRRERGRRRHEYMRAQLKVCLNRIVEVCDRESSKAEPTVASH